jgi:hypothetical protein
MVALEFLGGQCGSGCLPEVKSFYDPVLYVYYLITEPVKVVLPLSIKCGS